MLPKWNETVRRTEDVEGVEGFHQSSLVVLEEDEEALEIFLSQNFLKERTKAITITREITHQTPLAEEALRVELERI
jgi:hypothetical protein